MIIMIIVNLVTISLAFYCGKIFERYQWNQLIQSGKIRKPISK